MCLSKHKSRGRKVEAFLNIKVEEERLNENNYVFKFINIYIKNPLTIKN